MSFATVVAVSVAGGVGAMLRYLTGAAVPARFQQRFPWGIVVVNLVGAFLIGLVTGFSSTWLSQDWSVILASGLLGGYTTFSTASLDTVRLVQQQRYVSAMLHGLGVLAGCLVLGFGGFLLASQ